MNINYLEQQILKAIDIERQGIKEEDWSPYTYNTRAKKCKGGSII